MRTKRRNISVNILFIATKVTLNRRDATAEGEIDIGGGGNFRKFESLVPMVCSTVFITVTLCQPEQTYRHKSHTVTEIGGPRLYEKGFPSRHQKGMSP